MKFRFLLEIEDTELKSAEQARKWLQERLDSWGLDVVTATRADVSDHDRHQDREKRSLGVAPRAQGDTMTDDSKLTDLYQAILAMVLGLIVYPAQVMIEGYAGSIVWRWFLVERLHAPAVSTTTCVGISILAHLLWPYSIPKTDSTKTPLAKLVEGFFSWALRLGILFGLAAIVHAVGG
jgi:hypothetical protein